MKLKKIYSKSAEKYDLGIYDRVYSKSNEFDPAIKILSIKERSTKLITIQIWVIDDEDEKYTAMLVDIDRNINEKFGFSKMFKNWKEIEWSSDMDEFDFFIISVIPDTDIYVKKLNKFLDAEEAEELIKSMGEKMLDVLWAAWDEECKWKGGQG